MILLDVFGSESVTANLLQQVRWRDGATCPRCRSDHTVRNGSYREYQRYLCKNWALLNRHTALELAGHVLFDVVDETHQDNSTELTIPLKSRGALVLFDSAATAQQ